MKRLSISLIVAVIFMMCGVTFAYAEGMMLEYDGGTHEYNGEVYSLVVNNQWIDPPLSPIIFNDRALVPVREIFEEVGATVKYINDTQTVEVVSDTSYVTLRINDNVAYINGDKTNIPDNVVPKLIAKVGGETKTMVPVRFISESIGLDVEFNNEDGAILIESDGYTVTDNPQIPDEGNEIEEPDVVPYVTDVSYDIVDENNVKVTVQLDEATDNYDYFSLQSPERVVLDIFGARLTTMPDTIKIYQSGVSTVRIGDNGERSRIVVDASNLKSYNVTQPQPNQFEITVTTYTPALQPAPTVKPTKKPSVSSDKKLIVLDAGHGGSDSGAVGYLNGNAVLEKNLTLEITNRVKKILENAGYTVSMTRTGDTLPSLVERPTQANEENAAVFVSIHINSVDNAPEANGTEVFYATENNGDSYGATSAQLAQNILSRMLYYMGSTNRGVKTAEHAVTRRCNMPAALAEVGFITNPTEVYNMTTDEYQQKAAQGIAEGIMITLRDINIPN